MYCNVNSLQMAGIILSVTASPGFEPSTVSMKIDAKVAKEQTRKQPTAVGDPPGTAGVETRLRPH